MAITSQADQRRGAIWKDQHGRRFAGSVEKATGFPCGVVIPEFAVPDYRLVPDQKYLLFTADDPGRVTIDYPRWLKDLDDAATEWENRRIDYTNSMPGGAANPQLARLLGPKPMSMVPVRAMQQGNKWALGLSDVKPPEALTYFPEPEFTPDVAVFSGDVFSQASEARAERQKDAGALIAERMAELEKQVPEDLKGFARTKWLLEQLKGETVAQEA